MKTIKTHVTVEFFGIPRQRAGMPELSVQAGTLGEVLSSVENNCPGLKGLVQSSTGLTAAYRVSINGQRFVENLEETLAPGERILILSADAGG